MTPQRNKAWSQTTLGEALPIRYGKARTDKAGVVREDSPVYGSSGLIDKFDRALTNGPTLIIGRKGTVGATHYSPEPCWPIDTVYFAEASVEKDLRFFKHLLDHLQLGRMDRSTAVPGLSRDDYNAREVAIPDISEQRRIVAEIEKQFTRLEAGVAALRRVQANLKRYRAAVLKAACEGRLVPTEAELAKAENRKYETGEELLARVVTERRQTSPGRRQEQQPATPKASELVRLPDGWIWTTLGACFHVAVGATPSRKEGRFWGGTIPWVSSGEVRFKPIFETREMITSEGLENSSTHLNSSGSVLLGMIGEGKTRGQTAILRVAACNNQNCAAIRVSETPILPDYVYYWLWSQYDETRRTSSGNNQPALNKARVQAAPLPLPPVREQMRIVAEAERLLSVVEDLEAVVSANLQRAARLRHSILQSVFVDKPLGRRSTPHYATVATAGAPRSN